MHLTLSEIINVDKASFVGKRAALWKAASKGTQEMLFCRRFMIKLISGLSFYLNHSALVADLRPLIQQDMKGFWKLAGCVVSLRRALTGTS